MPKFKKAEEQPGRAPATSPAGFASASRDLALVFSPPVREALSVKVLEQLREAIMHGQFQPGEQLRETVLAAHFQVSRGPVREALVQLEREGLVIIRRNRTAVVARLTRQDLEEVYSLRTALEQVAARYAVQNATQANIEEMQRLVDVMLTRVPQGIGEKEAADLDLQFHDLLYRASQHRRVQLCWADLRPQIYVFLLSRNVANADFAVQMVGHREIVETLLNRDAVEIQRLIAEHIQGAYVRIARRYES